MLTIFFQGQVSLIFYEIIFGKQTRFQTDVYLDLLRDKHTAPTNDRTHYTFVMIWETSMLIITQQLDHIFKLLYESKNVPVFFFLSIPE